MIMKVKSGFVVPTEQQQIHRAGSIGLYWLCGDEARAFPDVTVISCLMEQDVAFIAHLPETFHFIYRLLRTELKDMFPGLVAWQWTVEVVLGTNE